MHSISNAIYTRLFYCHKNVYGGHEFDNQCPLRCHFHLIIISIEKNVIGNTARKKPVALKEIIAIG